MGKKEMRKELASLSFTEKVEILERLRDRSLEFSIVRISLVRSTGVAGTDQDEKIHNLERFAQQYLSAFLKGSPSRKPLSATLRAWLEGFGHVLFEVVIDGTPRQIVVDNLEDLDMLLGEGRTPADFLQVLARKATPSQSVNLIDK